MPISLLRCIALLLVMLVAALPSIGHAQTNSSPVITAVSPAVVSLADSIRVTLDGLQGPNGSRYDPASLRLRLDDHKFADVPPEQRSPNEVSFDLSELRKDSAGWLLLVGSPPFSGSKKIRVSISAPGLDIVGGKETTVSLQIFERWKLVAVGLIAAAILIAVVFLGGRTSILRDRESGWSVPV